jgi:hypothetical protein
MTCARGLSAALAVRCVGLPSYHSCLCSESEGAGQPIKRTEERFGLKPERLAADTAYGSAATFNWLVTEKQIAPHISVIDNVQG